MGGHVCERCDEEGPNMKRCAGCRKVWYCSTTCQTRHWVFHIFDCKPGKPISTVYHLARACYSDLIPVDAQTRRDYGFEKAEQILGGKAEMMLFGLYRGIFVYFDIPPQEVRQWWREGRLVEAIKERFEKLPANNRGAYYPWFLQHQYILDNSPMDEVKAKEDSIARANKMIQDAWVFTGGSPNDSVDAIKKKIAALPRHVQTCHSLYAGLVSHGHPNPTQDLWVQFGFVAAASGGEEMHYGRTYQDLIRLCTFDEFCAAFESSAIPALFDRCGLRMMDSHLFRDVMSGSPHVNKSVWDLKQYLDQLECSAPDDPERPRPVRSVMCDYGFMNCRNAAEWKLLDELYVELFRKARADPLELHEACIGGRLLEFAKRIVKLAPRTAVYARLLKNPYPLRIA